MNLLRRQRKKFSVVNQEIYLFNDTVRNNIKLFKQIEDEAIYKTIKENNLSKFIEEKSLDYDVGENGTLLSGGQRSSIRIRKA